jgi:hypothetical protein
MLTCIIPGRRGFEQKKDELPGSAVPVVRKSYFILPEGVSGRVE